jgi:hypothetical protein
MEGVVASRFARVWAIVTCHISLVVFSSHERCCVVSIDQSFLYLTRKLAESDFEPMFRRVDAASLRHNLG